MVHIKNVVLRTKFGVRLTTTTSTIDTIENDDIVVDWEEIPATKELVPTKICCPDVLSIMYNSYKACVNMCQKKVVPFPRETLVTCSNATFRRKMCKKLFTLEITLEDLTLTQTTVTVFPPVVKNVFSGPEEDMEEFFLSLERYDFIVNKKRIVEDIIKHEH